MIFNVYFKGLARAYLDMGRQTCSNMRLWKSSTFEGSKEILVWLCDKLLWGTWHKVNPEKRDLGRFVCYVND